MDENKRLSNQPNKIQRHFRGQIADWLRTQACTNQVAQPSWQWNRINWSVNWPRNSCSGYISQAKFGTFDHVPLNNVQNCNSEKTSTYLIWLWLTLTWKILIWYCVPTHELKSPDNWSKTITFLFEHQKYKIIFALIQKRAKNICNNWEIR